MADINDPSSFVTTASEFDLGTTLIICAYEHPVCPTLTDTLEIVTSLCNGFDPVIPTVFTPGNLDGSNDLFQISFLNAAHPECEVTIFNRWGSVVYESIGYDEPWDGTHNGEPLPMGTYFYRINLNDGTGKVLKGDISIIK